MRTSRVCPLQLGLAVSVLCWTGAASLCAQEAPAEKVTYNDHVLPIFKQRCGSCHNANDKKGGLVVDNYPGLMAGGSSGTAVEGGDAASSYLWSLVTHESEPKMPPNAAKLPDAELAVIRKWIDGGVLETSGSSAMVKKKSTVAKIEVSTARPTEVAIPLAWLGDPSMRSNLPNAVTALATSPWAPLAAVSGHKQVALYNTQTFDSLGVLPFPEGQPQIIKFSRNGSMLLVAGGRGGATGRVVVYDVKTGERKIEVGDEYDAVLAADISADQSLIALGGPKKMLRIYSTADGTLLHEVKKHTDWLTALEFSPDGVLLASADRSNGLFIWEAETGKEFYNLQGHQGAIHDVSWRPDSNVVASASEDGTIRLWEMENGSEIKKWNAHGGATAVDYIRDGRLVSTGRDRIVRLWNGDGAQVREFPGMTDIGMEVAFDAETERVLGGDWSGIVRIWNAADGAQLSQFDTNPPTLEMNLNSAKAALAAADTASQQAATAVAAMQKAMADKLALAEAATKKANEAAELAKKAGELKTTAAQTYTAKTAEFAKAEEALKAAEAALAAAKAAFEKATTEQKAATDGKATAAKLQAETLAAAQKAEADEKAAIENGTKLKVDADKAVAAAVVTPEQTKALQDAQAAAQAAAAQAAALKAKLEQFAQWQAARAQAAAPPAK